MSRQPYPLTNEAFMDDMFVVTSLRATGYLIFMCRMDSDYFDLTEWQSFEEAGA